MQMSKGSISPATFLMMWLGVFHLLYPPLAIDFLKDLKQWWAKLLFIILLYTLGPLCLVLMTAAAVVYYIGYATYALFFICSGKRYRPPESAYPYVQFLHPRHKYAIKNQLPTVRERSLTLVPGTTILHGNDFARNGEKEIATDAMDLEKGETQPRGKKKGHSEMVIQKTIDQRGNCQLLRLPPELRSMIWMHAVGGGHVHIFRRKSRLGSVFCPAGDPTSPLHRDLCSANKDDYGFHALTAWPLDRRPLSLLMTCRQIYTEAVTTLYATNTFAFDEADICRVFLESILPHRRGLITSIHLAPALDPNGVFTHRAEYSHYKLENWCWCIETLYSMPNLQLSRITVTPTLSTWPSDHTGTHEFGRGFRTFAQTMNNYLEKRGGSLTLAWCDAGHASNGFETCWERPEYLPSPLRMSLRTFEYRPKTQLLMFFIPMHVRCLHCHVPRIIRRGTKGLAEVSVIERRHMFLPSVESETAIPSPAASINHAGWLPARKRYCTFHSACGGWIEFQYESSREKWTVTGGAEEISEEQVKQHIDVHPGMYAPLEPSHEMVQGVAVKYEWDWGSSDRSGMAVDAETWDRLFETTSADHME